MKFTKVLAVTFFLIMIFIANSNVSGKLNFKCPLECAKTCFADPACIALCLKDCVACKAFNCKLACSMERCSKFKEDDERMGSCWNECATKECT
ncbi:hypothetical protein P3L10_011156 [Capsicum annuum]